MGFVEARRVSSSTVIRYEDGVRSIGSKKWCDGCGGWRSDIGSKEIPVADSNDSIWVCKECATDSEVSLNRTRDGLL